MFVDEGLGDPTAHGMSYGGCLLQPRSRGSVTLRSNDPTAKPWIRHNFYGEPEDVAVMLDVLRMTMEMSRTSALRPYCQEAFVAPAGDDEQTLRAHMARNSQTLYHPVGTCAIGTVVDSELRVHGTEGLRVVDASVMPTIVRGNTNAPTIAIAERAADLIRGGVAAAPAERAEAVA
jgi:choline dehydrogenase